MGVQINHYDMPETDFNQLGDKYPKGHYRSRNTTVWFNVIIEEMDLELTWFLERTLGDDSEE